METGGGTSGAKPIEEERVGVYDTDSSALSVSIASISTLSHLEAADAERALNED
jgi:hypothetical protein